MIDIQQIYTLQHTFYLKGLFARGTAGQTIPILLDVVTFLL